MDNDFVQIGSKKFPRRILEKLKTTALETDALIKVAVKDHTKYLNESFRFQIRNSAPQDILTDSERAAFHAFLAKIRSIPDFPSPSIVEKGDEYFLGNEGLAKHIITEFRPIIYNQNDPIYFGRIQGIIFQMLNRKSPVQGTKITVEGVSGSDITELFKKEFAACRAVIDKAITLMDLDYLFNGVLQHADQRFSERYSEDLRTGNLQYLYLKHATILTYLKHYLKPFEMCSSLFWLDGYPRSGSL